jgi:hypothetical protein
MSFVASSLDYLGWKIQRDVAGRLHPTQAKHIASSISELGGISVSNLHKMDHGSRIAP